jgi:hypothetical protein
MIINSGNVQSIAGIKKSPPIKDDGQEPKWSQRNNPYCDLLKNSLRIYNFFYYYAIISKNICRFEEKFKKRTEP